jgi:hypothetical protein
VLCRSTSSLAFVLLKGNECAYIIASPSSLSSPSPPSSSSLSLSLIYSHQGNGGGIIGLYLLDKVNDHRVCFASADKSVKAY